MYISGTTSTLICQRIINHAIAEAGSAKELCNMLAFNHKTTSETKHGKGSCPSRVILTIIYWMGPDKATKMLVEIIDEMKAKGLGTIDDYIATTERNKALREQRLGKYEAKYGRSGRKKKSSQIKKKQKSAKPLAKRVDI